MNGRFLLAFLLLLLAAAGAVVAWRSLRAPAHEAVAAGPVRLPAVLTALAGDWDVEVRTRRGPDEEWNGFATTAVLESLFDGTVLRERAGDGRTPWRELAFLRAEGSSGRLVFEHVFSGSYSMLRMTATPGDDGRSLEWSGRWHREVDGETRSSPASGRLRIESADRLVWRLDEHREDGTRYVDLEMVYTRRPSGS